MSFTNKSPSNHGKTNFKKILPLIISKKSIINHTGDASPSDFSDNDDWQSAKPNNKRIRSSNNDVSPLSKKKKPIQIFLSLKTASLLLHLQKTALWAISPTSLTKLALKKTLFFLPGISQDLAVRVLPKELWWFVQNCSQILKKKKNNVSFHSFQSKECKPFRIVVRNLHPTIDSSFIEDDLSNLGFNVKNITYVLHKPTKNSLPLFFIGLEQVENNADIFKLTSLCYTKIKVEAYLIYFEPFILKYNFNLLNENQKSLIIILIIINFYWRIL